MRKRYKIAVYSGVVPSTTFIERLISGLASEGDQIVLFGTLLGKTEKLQKINYVTYTNYFSKLLVLFKYSILLSLLKPNQKIRLDRIIAKSNKSPIALKLKYYPVLFHSPDIFHLQWAKSISDWMWVREFGMKLIVGLRGAHINYSPVADEVLAETYRTCFPKVDGFHAVSKAIAAEAVKYNAGRERIRVVYSGLQMNKLLFDKKGTKNKTPLQIISVGRSHWKKGYVHALKSIALLKEKGVDVAYTLVGIENDEELLYLRTYFDLRNEVRFLKSLEFEMVIDLVKEAQVLLLSSVEEGIANVVLESMAVGTIVVSTDCGGMDEVITDGENGFLVPVRNPDAMAEALRKVSELSADEYDRMVINARRKIEEQHSLESMVSGMRSLYRNVITDKL